MSYKKSLHAIIMAGGKGTRFWPKSTGRNPKQYLSLVSKKSLLAATLERFENLVGNEERYLVTVKDQKSLAMRESQGQMPAENIIFEPSGRNTGPCILLALAALKRKGIAGSEVVAVVPSDHVILNVAGFRETLKKAAAVAEVESGIVTIGITPHFPHTGYGYIESGANFKVESFREKPDFEMAKKYVASGKYLWNAGMFVAKLDILLSEFESHAPEMYAFFDQLVAAASEDEITFIYNQIPAESIDYAVMEKSERVFVIPASFDWNDLGSWDALESVIEAQAGNTVAHAREVLALEAKGNIVYAPEKVVALLGVEDLVVISSDEVIAVFPKKDSQRIKELVELAKERGLEELL